MLGAQGPASLWGGPQEPPSSNSSPRNPLDTCDASVAPLEAPVQGSGLGCSRPGCGTGVAGRAGDGLGRPGPLPCFLWGTLPTLITLPAVPHVPLRFSLGLLLVELGKRGVPGLGTGCLPETAGPHLGVGQFPLLLPHLESLTQVTCPVNGVQQI